MGTNFGGLDEGGGGLYLFFLQDFFFGKEE